MVEPFGQMPGDNSRFAPTMVFRDQIFLGWVKHTDNLYQQSGQQMGPTSVAVVTLQSATNALSAPAVAPYHLAWAE